MKTSLKILIIFTLLAAGVFLVQNLDNWTRISQPPAELGESPKLQPEIVVKLILDLGNGNIKTFDNIGLKDERTVFTLLKKVTQENNLEFTFKEYQDLGVFVESIDNIANDAKNNKWWQYWVDGQYAKVGPNNYQLSDGDLVEWKYVKSQF